MNQVVVLAVPVLGLTLEVDASCDVCGGVRREKKCKIHKIMCSIKYCIFVRAFKRGFYFFIE